jgi:hypothetical protein
MDEPLQGWNFSEVLNSDKTTKVPPNDIYGNLFFHVRKILIDFLQRVEHLSITVEMRCEDGTDLSKIFQREEKKFDIIETSNLADPNYIGHNKLLTLWAPLLKKTGTLTSFLLDWLDTNDPRLMKLYSKDPANFDLLKLTSLDTSLFWDLQRKTDLSSLFLDFLRKENTFEVAKKLKLHFQMKSTIVPFRDGTKVGDPIATAPYIDNQLISYFLNNNYMHYCEWKK